MVYVIDDAVNNHKSYCVMLRTLGYFFLGVCRYPLDDGRKMGGSAQLDVFQSFPVGVNNSLTQGREITP